MNDIIRSCFKNIHEESPIKIKHLNWYAEKNTKYIISILTEEVYDVNGRGINMNCILPEKYFDYKKFHQSFPDYEIDCLDSYHFVVYKYKNN